MISRPLPRAIQSFKRIRRDGYVYVDKTDLVWKLVNEPDIFYYLSRPRRFGKSLLVDTLECYLTGQKELFEGLKIMDLEKDWTVHPVIRLDMSRGGATAKTIRSYLDICFEHYEAEYGITPKSTAELADRFNAIIMAAYRKSGQQVAILIDEYDSPLQHSWKTPEHEQCTDVYREVFAILKADDEYEKLVFITGITKFTQISLFSVMNNLCNISFDPRFTTICGITEQELHDTFQQELQEMAAQNGWTMQQTHQRLKEYYDGYHFCRKNMVDIYNPFSLVNALNDKDIRNYWVSSGATTLLPKFIDDAELHVKDFEECRVMRNTLETSDVNNGGAELFLYQSGYLTIKHSDEFGYTLGFPNEEVKQALYDTVLPALTMRKQNEVKSIQANLYYQLGTGKLNEAMQSMKALVADVPFSNKKLASINMEERYRLIISTILNAIGLRVEVEHQLAKGIIDVVCWSPYYIYVMELKLQNNGGIKAAANQIRTKGYLEPFKADSRKVVGLAIELDNQGKGIIGWQEIE